ncbi:MAG: uroporphyrinogen-III C-methyltransferase [FCB group bacterium]|nr:uroporphyrinogen-III C-methyltransferase [FCB group bacterium]
MNLLYPIFLDLRDRPCLVVGGGNVAFNKIKRLLSSRAKITLISPRLDERLRPLVKSGVLRHRERTFKRGDVNGFFLVIGATDDREVNRLVYEEAVALGIPVNITDQPALCTFFLGATHQTGELKIAVSTNGASPEFACCIRDDLAQTYGDEYARALDFLKEYRATVREKLNDRKERRRTLKQEARKQFAGIPKPVWETEKFKKGTVYLVGAGPGDPDLITVKALQAVRKADVIFYDRLIDKRILNEARTTLLFPVSKRAGHHSFPQDQINALLAEYASQKKMVVRLKGGDPFVFGRGGEEAEFLKEKGIPFQVIPGVTSGTAVPAYAGIPLTHRDYGSKVIFVSGHGKRNTRDLSWLELAGKLDTTVVFMGLNTLPQLVAEMKRRKWPGTSPIAVISEGTQPSQNTIVSTLDDVEAMCQKKGSKSPALIVIGPTVQLHKNLNWYHPEKICANT